MVFQAETDLCQIGPMAEWTEWTSCEFFCGTPRISQKTRERASGGSDGDCRRDIDVKTRHDTSVHILTQVEGCAASQQCRCEYSSHMTKLIYTFLPAPFIFGNWTSTLYCNETCGNNRFGLELRTCNLVNPNLPANISCQTQLTLRTGDSRCPPSSINCTGKI